jgi:hypothetical protein
MVFGSNEAGRHGKGAALVAFKQYGARYGMSYGHVGDSFAIPTKDRELRPLPISRIGQYVQGFLAYAAGHPELTFKVTRIGCGLAGFADREIAPLFVEATRNCLFDEAWHPYLGDDRNYWGSVP